MFFVVSATALAAAAAPLLVFREEGTVSNEHWDARQWAAAWFTLAVCAATVVAASAWSHENLRPFADWKGVAAALGAGLLIVAAQNLATGRCSYRTGGRWIHGRTLRFEGRRTRVVAALRALSGATLVGMAFSSM